MVRGRKKAKSDLKELRLHFLALLFYYIAEYCRTHYRSKFGEKSKKSAKKLRLHLKISGFLMAVTDCNISRLHILEGLIYKYR